MRASLRLVSRLTGLALWPFMREVTGTENVPRSGPCVLVANHISVLDGVVLGAVMNNRVRHAHFVSYKYLYDGFLSGFILRLNQGVSLDSSSAEGRERALNECRRLLGEGKVIALFPEAHTAPVGEMRKAKSGVAFLALQSGAPVVPVGLVGTQQVMPREGDLPGRRWNAISVHFGGAVPLNRYRQLFADAGKRERLDIATGVSTIIMRSVAGLSGQEYRHGTRALSRLERLSAASSG